MHTPSFVQLLATGLVASSTVASFQFPAAGAISLRSVGTLVAIAAPALALPAAIEEREPRESLRSGTYVAP